MKLDKRIKSVSDIITCFVGDKDRAKQYVGQVGYFADDMMNFNNLEGCIYGKLENYVIDEDYPFKCMPADIHYAFFIPESVLKPKEKEKKYRPYTLIEFIDKFTIGRPVSFRRKDMKYSKYLVFSGYWDEPCEGKIVTYISFNSFSFTLDVLFDEYEWQETSNTGNWKPFGVE